METFFEKVIAEQMYDFANLFSLRSSIELFFVQKESRNDKIEFCPIVHLSANKSWSKMHFPSVIKRGFSVCHTSKNGLFL